MLLIAVGLFMFTYESTQFNLEGFIMVLAASVIGGLRWSLAQILTQKKELGEYSISIRMVFYVFKSISEILCMYLIVDE